LKRPSPYNTYLNAGLPPTPICSPGLASIRAVLYPAETDFLYFVSKNDGSHYFSKSLEEHQRAVIEYQRSR
ncbi:MAG: endolytic transglycosylase MltG, partial [Deltaproteobacteria bacterium]|nr:endolytic transglycosylase MltG [Deltaproteobacteria bacterium]